MHKAPKEDKLRKSKLPRLTWWWLIALALSLAVFLIAPQQLPVSIYKLNLIALAAVAGYWIDRSVFPYARPQVSALRALDQLPDIELTEDESQRGVATLDNGQELSLECLVEGLSRPTDPVPIMFVAACMLRRAIIMSAAILAISLGA